MKNLSIIIPVYNEEKAIGETVKFFDHFLDKNPETEVIFVNDCSRDKTSQILNKIKNKKIKVINQTKNKGYGASIKKGLKDASYEYIAVIDADSSYPYEKIAELFKKLLEENADMAVGARVGKVRRIGIFRKFGKYIVRKFAEHLSEEEIPDLNSGLRIVKKNLTLKLLKLLPDGFSFTSTLTLSFLASNQKIIYVPVNYYKRKGKSKIKPIRDTLNFFQIIIRTIMYFNPLRVFIPLSLILFLISIGVFLYSYFLSEKVMDITTVILFVSSLQILAIGMIADLIVKKSKQ